MNFTCVNHRMLWLRSLGAMAAAALVFGSIAQSLGQNQPTNNADSGVGDVFALTNVAEKNEVAIFGRTANGTLYQVGRVSTRGNGTGSPLDSQGALILSEDKRWLYAVNPGSDEISVFDVRRRNSPRFIQKVKSGGDLPLSLTIHGNLLYVLNSGTGSNIFGFRVGRDGMLIPLDGSFRRVAYALPVMRRGH